MRIHSGPAVAHYPPGATLGPRVMPCFELVWMLSGCARWQCEGAEPVTLQPGVLLLSHPDLTEHYRWDPDRPCVHAYVMFYIDDFGSLGAAGDWPAVRRFSAQDPLAALCRYVLWLGGTEAAAPARIEEVLGWLVDLFVSGPFPDGTTLPERIAPLLEHLRTTWRDAEMRPLRLEELASAARISPGHLARIFRQHYGIGPVSAMELIRLARAATLLQRSNLTVGAVSEACGFTNPFHFSRRFKASFGAAPRAYRSSPPQEPLDPVRKAGLLPLAQQLLGDDVSSP